MEGIQRLKWVVEFLGLNLEKLSPGDRAKLAVEFRQYLYPKKGEIVLMGQNKWGAGLPQKGNEIFWYQVNLIQNVINSFFGFYAIGEGERIEFPAYGRFVVVREKENLSVNFVPQVDTFADYIRLNLLFDLRGMPISFIHRCPACERIFLNTTKKEKRFCSPNCLWRYNAKKRREADPEGYRERQKEIMRERYAKAKREKLGPNIKINSKK
jgi:hypothetical protein